MTTATIIIAILSLVLGYISQAVQTGKFLGIVTVPTTWLPYLTLIGTFLAAFVQSISSATVVNQSTIVAAILAGLAALTGVTIGVTVHQHITAKPANDNGSFRKAA